MQYRLDKKSGNNLSALGLGCMRFPRGGPALSGTLAAGGIDYAKTQALVCRAVESGINYFDTAYIYPGSEEMLGRILEANNLRDKVYIASKMPVILCKERPDFDKFFDKQLERLRTGRIDYYLMHMLTGMSCWNKMKEMGIVEWAAEKKKSGAIGQFGFSFHGARDEFAALLDDFDWDFCQIQYNYSNENYQAGTVGLQKAAALGIPVIIMEPLLGGKLAGALPPHAASVFRAARPDSTPAEWALRWLWDKEEVSVVLSGMTNIVDLEQNLASCEKSGVGTVSPAEREVYAAALQEFRAFDKVPCTGCGYCASCPRGVDIPSCFAAFNASFAFGRIEGWKQYVTSVMLKEGKSANAARCVKCRRCEEHCPQKIPIADALAAVQKRMEPLWFRALLGIVDKVRKR